MWLKQYGISMNGLPSQANRIAIFLIALQWGFVSCCFSSANAEEKPAWQNGISTWNGQDYDLPAISGNEKEFTLPTATPKEMPYTIPTNPGAANAVLSLPGRRLGTNPEAPKVVSAEDALSGITMPTDFADRSSWTASGSDDVNSGIKKWQAGPPLPKIDSAVDVQRSNLDFNAGMNAEPVSLSDARSNNESRTTLDLPAEFPATDAAGPGTAAGLGPGTDTESESVEVVEPFPSGQTPLTEQQNSNWQVSEPTPLQTEVTRWYQYPRRWMNGWDSHAEFGLDGSDGNANTLAIQAGMELKRKTDQYTLGMDINYRQASSRNKTTEENGRFNIDFDRLLGNTSWSAFVKHGMEWDRFKPFDLRLNLNAGTGYFWIRNDDTTLVTRFGAGASREIGAPMDDWVPEAVLGFEAERQMTARQKLKGKFDYFPAWEDFGNYRLVSDVSWEILLDGSENLSLKLAATDRYDSSPQGAKPNDVYYSLLLLYKF
jgi:putative salt-induced outer membrane protein YdiY